MASECLREMPTGPRVNPLRKPACSTSQAAGIFTRLPSAGHLGRGWPRRAAGASTPAPFSWLVTGFFQEEAGQGLGGVGERGRVLAPGEVVLQVGVGEVRPASDGEQEGDAQDDVA